MGPPTRWGPGQSAPVAPPCRRPCMQAKTNSFKWKGGMSHSCMNINQDEL